MRQVSPGWQALGAEAARGATSDSRRLNFKDRVRRRRILIASVCVTIIILLWLVAVRTARGQIIDTAAMYALQQRVALQGWPSKVLHWLVSEPSFIVMTVLVLGLAVVRRRVALGIRVLLVFVAANVTTQVLKVLFDRPELGVGHYLENSLPSGHVTAVASLGIVLTAIFPRGARSSIAAGSAVLTAAVGIAVIGLGWHRPSDVVAAIAVVTVFAMIGLPSEYVPGRHTGVRTVLTTAAVVLGIGAAIGLIVVTRLMPQYQGDHVTAAELYAAMSSALPGALLAVTVCALVTSAAAAMAAVVDGLAGE